MRDVDKGPGHPGRAVMCDNKEYPTIASAVKALKMSTLSVRIRCLSPDYPDWYFIDDGNLANFEKEDIKQRFKDGQAVKDIADAYQMSQAWIYKILSKK